MFFIRARERSIRLSTQLSFDVGAYIAGVRHLEADISHFLTHEEHVRFLVCSRLKLLVFKERSATSTADVSSTN